MKKMKMWEGQKPERTISIKLDGIQAMLNEHNEVVSRSGKPLHNISPYLLEQGKKYECFLGTFKKTDSVLSTYNHAYKVGKEELFEIWPEIDERLRVAVDEDVQDMFAAVLSMGFEGLVIDHKYKVKPKENYDVPIIGIEISAKGQFKGLMGALITPMGKVGTGFTKAMRGEIWTIGEVIEVECMELTPDGKFRHPRFVRRRWDKPLIE